MTHTQSCTPALTRKLSCNSFGKIVDLTLTDIGELCFAGNCSFGQEYNQADTLQCDDCPLDKFQDKSYPLVTDRCEACPTGFFTAQTASTSDLCVGEQPSIDSTIDPSLRVSLLLKFLILWFALFLEFCDSGKEYVNMACQDCAINFYKDNDAGDRAQYSKCVECPADLNRRTLSTGATAESDCSVSTYTVRFLYEFT